MKIHHFSALFRENPTAAGYVYDELPPDPLELRVMEEPIFVAFENIEVTRKTKGRGLPHPYHSTQENKMEIAGLRKKLWPA